MSIAFRSPTLPDSGRHRVTEQGQTASESAASGYHSGSSSAKPQSQLKRRRVPALAHRLLPASQCLLAQTFPWRFSLVYFSPPQLRHQSSRMWRQLWWSSLPSSHVWSRVSLSGKNFSCVPETLLWKNVFSCPCDHVWRSVATVSALPVEPVPTSLAAPLVVYSIVPSWRRCTSLAFILRYPATCRPTIIRI